MTATILALACTMAPATLQEDGQTYARPGMLVEAAQLAKNIDKGNLAILDARSKKDYEAGHIPGAIWVDVGTWKKAFSADRSPDVWSKHIAKLGLSPRRTVVIYDDSMSKNAARVWGILRYWNFDNVQLLNGGWKAWTASKHPVSKTGVAIRAIKLGLGRPEQDRFKDKDQVLQHLKEKKTQIVDTRSEGEHCGTTKLAKRGGAIPGAIHLEWSDLLDKKTHRFKSAAELRQILKKSGIDLNQPIVTHCQSGGRASVMVFGLELMGANEVSNYHRGWSEWGNHAATPIVQPKKK